MTPQDVIDSYVTAVAAQLPTRLRNDVAAELRGQLADEFNASGKKDEASALALVRRFGRPAAVAARYHEPYTIVDPIDTRSFVLAAIAGALLIPPANARLPISIDPRTASLLFLAWIGTLALFFAVRSWAMRRWPDSFAFAPSPPRKGISVPGELAAAFVFVLLEVAYLAPGPVAALLSGGRVDAAHFAYSASFLQPLRLWGLALILPLLAAFHLSAVLMRRWYRFVHVLAILFLLCAGIQLGWHAAYGDIFADPAVDRGARLAFQLAGGLLVIIALIELYREWSLVLLPEEKTHIVPAQLH
jgi:hypothetical protein